MKPNNYKVDGEIAYRTIGDETIIMKPVQLKCYMLNPTASMIWNLVIRGKTVDEIIIECAQRYSNNDKLQLQEDIESTINHFVRLGFLNVV